MSQPTSTPTQSPSTQQPTTAATPATIQIQLPPELIRSPAPTPGIPGDISSSLMLIAFAIVVKVTLDNLKPN